MISSAKNALFSTAYLPPLSYFGTLLKFESITIEAFENFPKQTYRNRCRILGPNGEQVLSIPTLKSADPKRLMKDVRIANTGRWQQIHWRSILTAYSKSPYFMYYRDAFEPFYQKSYPFLMDYNNELLLLVLKLLKLNCKVQYSEEFVEIGKHISDYRYSFSPKKEEVQGLPPYYQVFRERSAFVSDLSILDVLFNLGPDALKYLCDLKLK